MIRRTMLMVGALLLAGVWFGTAAHADSYTPQVNPPSEAPAVQVAGRVQDPGTVSASGQLPQTGSSSTETLLRVGIVLVASGGVLAFAARRRTATAR
jgi:LPXTG-motif cell wall-anchored protein